MSIRQQLREQACRGKAFLLVTGPSGSGKSSLARAGVLPDICEFEIDANVKRWRQLVLKPSELGYPLLSGFVSSLSHERVLPELRRWQADLEVPNGQDGFAEWKTKLVIRVQDALGLNSRLLILVDQLEELFSIHSIRDAERSQWLEVLESLSSSGKVWLIATIRSDFYHQLQQIPALVRMKEGAGQFDLLTPAPDALSRVITGPAMLAGLRFEREGELTLADAILREAAEHRELLPLVEHLLLELCQRRSADGVLTFAEYRELGGMKGALRRRCEHTLNSVSPAAQQSLDYVLSELVTLSGDGLETYVRRTVALDRFDPDSPKRELVDAMVAARLFTATQDPSGASVLSVAHEALLRVWPRAVEWGNNNREFLRLRATVEQACARWQSKDRDKSLLLSSGLPLEEGRKLLEFGNSRVDEPIVDYIRQSIVAEESNQRRVARRRRLTVSVLSVLSLVLAGLGIYALQQANTARVALAEVENKNVELGHKTEEVSRERDRAQSALDREHEARQEVEATAQRLEATLARSSYFLAGARWKEGRVREAQQLLQQVPPKHRNFEWYFDARKYQGGYMTIHGVQLLSLSPDGSQIASKTIDNKIKFWDASSGEELRTFNSHSRSVLDKVEINQDWTLAASVSSDYTIVIWDMANGEEIRTLPGHINPIPTTPAGRKHPVSSIAFSPDGTLIATGSSDHTIKLWSVTDGVELRTLNGHTDWVWNVIFSSDGTQIVSESGDRTMRLWDVGSGKELHKFVGNKQSIQYPAFSPEGTMIAGCVGPSVRLWDSNSFEGLNTRIVNTSDVSCVAFSPDGMRIATGNRDNTIAVWNRSSGTRLTTLVGHRATVSRIEFSPDGGRLISTGSDKEVKLWDVRYEDDSRLMGSTMSSVTSLAYSSDGTSMVSGTSDGRIVLWDMDKVELISTLTGHANGVYCVALSPDGTKYLSGGADTTIKLWDVTNREELRTFTGHSQRVNCVAFSPDGRQFVSGSSDNTIRLWDVLSGVKVRTLKNDPGGPVDGVWSVTFSPDGTTIASAGSDNKVTVWDVDSGEKLQTLSGHTDSIGELDYSPKGELIASASGDKTIKIWNVSTGRESRTLAGHGDGVLSVKFNSDGSRIISGSRDGTMKLWDTASGDELRTFSGHHHPVSVVRFSPDNTRIASGSWDGSINLWEVAAGVESRMLDNANPVSLASISPDGRFVAAAGQTEISLWDVESGELIRSFFAHDRSVSSLAFNPSGTILASGGRDNVVRLWDVEMDHEIHALRGHSSELAQLEFSPDGERIETVDVRGYRHVWEVRSGNEIETSENRDRNIAPRIRQSYSSDGRLFVYGADHDVVLVDLQFKHTPREMTFRQSKAKPDAWWHLKQASSAEESRNWYAATFHRAWVVRSLELSGRVEDERFADAPDALLHAYAAWRESRQDTPANELPDPDILLHPIVREVLRSMSVSD